MDDQAKAIKWYLDNSTKLDLRIKKFKWNLAFDSSRIYLDQLKINKDFFGKWSESITPFGFSFELGCHIQWSLEQENLEYLKFAEFGNKSDLHFEHVIYTKAV